MKQGAIWAVDEGDRWFERNREALTSFDPATDLPLRLLDLYGVRPGSVLEIGSSKGFRLAALAASGTSRAVGVEVSGAAVIDGRTRYPEIELHQGGSEALPVEGLFDVGDRELCVQRCRPVGTAALGGGDRPDSG